MAAADGSEGARTMLYQELPGNSSRTYIYMQMFECMQHIYKPVHAARVSIKINADPLSDGLCDVRCGSVSIAVV